MADPNVDGDQILEAQLYEAQQLALELFTTVTNQTVQ